MKPSCQDIQDRLVAYTDGELTSEQTREVTNHLSKCPDCAALAQALDQSLSITQDLWTEACDQAASIQIPDIPRAQRWPRLRRIGVAAVILFVLGITSISLIKTRTAPTAVPEPTQANIEQEIQLSSRLARQRMVAQILASCEGTEEMVQRQNEYIAKTFKTTHQP